MKGLAPLLVSSSDAGGGAFAAALKLHLALRKQRCASRLLVEFKRSQVPNVIGPPADLDTRLQSFYQYLPSRLFGARQKSLFSPSLAPSWAPKVIKKLNPDLVHLHWVQEGTLNINDLTRIQKPMVLSLHDSWAFTGGCHLPQQCERWKIGCGSCPQLKFSFPWDLSNYIWSRKNRLWKNLPLMITCPSEAFAQKVRQSPFLSRFEVEAIPNAIAPNDFKPMAKIIARKKLGLNPKGAYVLSGAFNFMADPNKGLDLLCASLARIKTKNVTALIFGETAFARQLNLPVPAIPLGKLSNPKGMHLAYSAADTVVSPSRSENLPTVVMEAMACARPVLAFNIPSLDEMLQHRRSGWLAAPYNTADLARGIDWALSKKAAGAGAKARRKVIKEFSQEKVAKRMLGLYERVVDLAKI